jgi:hypothetical protein
MAMNIVWLCRYICVVCILLFVSGMLISHAPSAELLIVVHQVLAGCGAFIAFIGAIYLNRLPATHWAHRSKPLWVAFLAIAVAVTALVVTVG